VIELTDEEKQLVKEGRLNPTEIMEHRKINPPKIPEKSEIEQVKQEIRDANLRYKEAIQRNKDLYVELEKNRKDKEEYRNKIAELRKRKKELLGE